MSGSQNADVFVVGGGPAGLAAAIAARQKGFSVVVADGSAPPIEKPCGEGMLPETMSVLAEIGISFQPAEGRKFRGISFVQANASIRADFASGFGLGMRRPCLHERMVSRAEQCGVKFLWRTPVSGIDCNLIHTARGTTRARFIVGADGHGSRVRRWAGLDGESISKQRYATRHHYRIAPWSDYMEIHWGKRVQAYVTPISQDEVCVVTIGETVGESQFETALLEMPMLRERLSGASLSSRERGAVSSTRRLNRVQQSNLALVGDASGGVDAITGEGLRLAFCQAPVLADAMIAGDLSKYERAHRRIARRPMLMGNLMLFLSRHARLRARTIRAMQRQPKLFERLLAAHVGQASCANLLTTGALLGLRLASPQGALIT